MKREKVNQFFLPKGEIVKKGIPVKRRVTLFIFLKVYK